MEQWLSLRVQDALGSKAHSKKVQIHISVPKRLVKQAVERNRIKRVLREALRERHRMIPDKVYFFKVLRQPDLIHLRSAKQMLGVLGVE